MGRHMGAVSSGKVRLRRDAQRVANAPSKMRSFETRVIEAAVNVLVERIGAMLSCSHAAARSGSIPSHSSACTSVCSCESTSSSASIASLE